MKKVLCILLAAVMLLMVGCNSTQKPEETTTTAEETKAEEKKEEVKTEETAKEEAPAEETVEEPAEFDEAAWLPISDTNETLSLGISQHASIPDYDNHELTKWLEETSGVNLEFVYFTGTSKEIQQQVALMVAGGETLPDILFGLNLPTEFVNELGRDGYLVELSDMVGTELTPYMNQHYAELSEDVLERESVAVPDPLDGARYRVPMIQDVQSSSSVQSAVYINQKWLDNLELKEPTNIQELYDVLVAFRDQDPNGNGKKDEIPMIGDLSDSGDFILGYIINAYVYYNVDEDYHLNATDGKLWAPWTTEEYREALKTLHQWQAEGLIEPHCFTGISASDVKPIYTPEDQVAVAGVISGTLSSNMVKDNPIIFEYTVLDYIADGETDKGGYLVVNPTVVGTTSMMITADCKNPELAMKFIDFIHKDEAVASFRHGIQGVNWDWADPEQKDRTAANIAILDDGQAFFEGIYTWRRNVGGVATPNNYSKVAAGDTEWLAYEKEMGDYYVKEMYPNARYPEEVVTAFALTSEESEYYKSVYVLLNDYIKESLAKFGTGVWDPNSDADWETYLSELESIGLSKYLEVCQAAYTRLKSK